MKTIGKAGQGFNKFLGGLAKGSWSIVLRLSLIILAGWIIYLILWQILWPMVVPYWNQISQWPVIREIVAVFNDILGQITGGVNG